MFMNFLCLYINIALNYYMLLCGIYECVCNSLTCLNILIDKHPESSTENNGFYF